MASNDDKLKNNFHIMRLIAAFMVLFGHSYPLTGNNFVPDILGVPVHSFAVMIFFSISGYLIADSWNNDRCFHRYIIRRILRIMPALIVVVLITALLVGPVVSELKFSEYFHQRGVLIYFLNILLAPVYSLPKVFIHNVASLDVNGVLWTIPIEMLMYLLVPLYATVGGGLLSWAFRCCLGLIFLVGGVYAAVLRPGELGPVFYFSSISSFQILRLAPFFFMGALIRIFNIERFLNLQTAIIILIITGCCGSEIREILLFASIPYTILSFCLARPAIFGKCSSWPDFSYGIYLYGFLVQQVIIQLFANIRPLTVTFMAAPLTLICACMSWYLIEKPALHLKPSTSKSLLVGKIVLSSDKLIWPWSIKEKISACLFYKK